MKKVLVLCIIVIFCFGIIGCEKTKGEGQAAERETFVAIQEDEVVRGKEN